MAVGDPWMIALSREEAHRLTVGFRNIRRALGAEGMRRIGPEGLEVLNLDDALPDERA